MTKLLGVLDASENRKEDVRNGTSTAARSTQQRNPSKSKGSVSSSARKQVLAVRRPFAVFDIDGTLIRWQLYHAVVDELGHQGYIDKKSYTAIKQARLVWKRREHQKAFPEYEKQIIKIYDSVITDIGVNKFNKIVKNVFDEYKDQVYTYTRELIKDLKAKGYVLLAISGSPEQAVGLIAGYYGFDDFVGSTYYHKGDKFTGKKTVAALDKKAELDKLLAKHHLGLKGSIAVGDSESDIPLLEAVERPIVFNPTVQLYNKACQNGWEIIVERKNVIYELRDSNGNYILA